MIATTVEKFGPVRSVKPSLVFELGVPLAAKVGQLIDRRSGLDEEAAGVDEDQVREIDVGEPRLRLRRVGAFEIGAACSDHLQAFGDGTGPPGRLRTDAGRARFGALKPCECGISVLSDAF